MLTQNTFSNESQGYESSPQSLKDGRWKLEIEEEGKLRFCVSGDGEFVGMEQR